jgi:sugar lactone lactonase YvrE
MNSLALDPRGRLFGTQVFLGDALWEFDRAGKQAPRLVRKDLGGLNGFDFAPDGRLCGPLWFRARVVCLDVDSGAMEVVAEGFTTPAAANFDPEGELHAIDNATGEVFHIDRAAHTKTRIATAPTNLDNLAFAPDGRLFVTNMPDNAIYEIDRASGAIRTVISSPLTLPGGIARSGGTLYVADTFALSAVDLASGTVRDISRDGEASGAPSLVAANDTHVATASLHRESVALWDVASLQVVAQWSNLGRPSAIALGPNRRIVVATADGLLFELDPARPESRRELARGLAMPMGLVRTTKGWIVSEAASGQLLVIGDDGTRRILASELRHPEGIAWLADGRIAVAETAADRVTLVDPATGRKETIATGLPLGLLDLPGMPPGIFPTGLAATEDGALLLSSDVEGGVLRLRPSRP